MQNRGDVCTLTFLFSLTVLELRYNRKIKVPTKDSLNTDKY